MCIACLQVKIKHQLTTWDRHLREYCDEEVEQHDVADEEINREKDRHDVVVVRQVVDVRLVAVPRAGVNDDKVDVFVVVGKVYLLGAV